jgi:Spermidine synthase
MPMLLIFITGACAAFINALLFRELFPVFQANDLIAGVIISHALFSFSAGMFAASKIKTLQKSDKSMPVLLTCAAIVLFAAFIFTRDIRAFLNISLGGGISLKIMFFYVFAAIFPPAFIQGIISFTSCYFIKNTENKDIKTSFKKSLLLQGLGFAAGCAAYFLFMYGSLGFEIALIVSALFFIAAALSAEVKKIKLLLFLVSFIPVLSIFCLDTASADKKILEKSFNFSEIAEYKYTSYGQSVLTQKNKEYYLLVNQILQFSSPDNDILNSEDFGHIPVLYHEKPGNVLIIGGAAKYLPMVLEHKVKRVDYLESDKAVVDIIKSNIFRLGYVFEDERVHIYNDDARKFLKNSRRKYSLILVGFPDPVNLQLNGFYTKEFFETAKRSLRKSGFIAVKLPGTMAFSTYIMAELNKSVTEAMQAAFKNVDIISGSQNILIASDRKMPYRMHIKKRLYNMQETTLVLSKYYLDDRMDTEKTRWLKNELNKVGNDELLNSDWNPRAMILSVLHRQSGFSPYLSLFTDKFMQYAYLIVAFVIIIFFMSKSIYKASAFVSGSASVWLFAVLLAALQIYSGELLRFFSLLSALFVAGMLAGGIYAANSKNVKPLNRVMFDAELLFVLWIILILLAFKFYIINICIICIFMFCTGFVAAFEFMQLIKITDLFRENSKDNSKIYFIGVLGGCFSALAGGGFLIVVWGIEKALVFMLFMKFLVFCRWADLKKRGL